MFLTLTGQQSPENDNTIKDLLPEDAGIDHQTVHQLITVLMKFMARDESSAESDISSAKAFNTVKRHLYVLLGYDQQEGCFMIAPQKMRLSTCFNAFIAGIAQVSGMTLSGVPLGFWWKQDTPFRLVNAECESLFKLLGKGNTKMEEELVTLYSKGKVSEMYVTQH